MSKASAKYHRLSDGSPFEVEYDTDDPCHFCGLPVIAASMGGTACCPWCDLGTCRFDRSHRVDIDYDLSTGKIKSPRAHYERWHLEAFGETP